MVDANVDVLYRCEGRRRPEHKNCVLVFINIFSESLWISQSCYKGMGGGGGREVNVLYNTVVLVRVL